ncbi:DUF4198 domain-containing protein [Xylophilus sp.]|uniref:DUF4198 domain-containing protein n=1 Tax=Xylophilus sp. TaxID=2653893 RepID=UPI0013B65CD0|nr:DUF4198 domain-containing protein [Xylophilus sp.]KAF1049575.1 MAG: hypothetical protein GAK38_00674 [Xylophilus sp.]
MKASFRLLALAAALAASAAQAHQIWLEQPAAGQNPVIRFGEFGENLREASPGLLDRFGQPTATLLSSRGESPLAVTKTADGFRLAGRPAAGESIVAEDAAFPLRKFKQGDKEVTSWYRPAARFATRLDAQQPRLDFDITPTGKQGEFRVTFKGQPLPKAKVQVLVQSGWAKEEHADEQGLVHFDLPWKGQYVIEASHIDRTPGERQGSNGAEKYDGVNYVTTLTFVKTGGAAAIAAGPAAKPNQ